MKILRRFKLSVYYSSVKRIQCLF